MARTWRCVGTALLALPISGVALLSGGGVAGADIPTDQVVAPVDAQFNQIGASVVVTWTTPDSASAGSSVTAWIDSDSSDSCTAELAAGTCTIDFSDYSVAHEVFVQVTGADGVTTSEVSDLGATQTLIPVDPIPVPRPDPGPIVDPVPTPPSALDALSAVATDGSVVVTWTPGTGNGNVYAWASSDDGSSWGWCWADLAAGSCEITGLVDGVAHDVSVITEAEGLFGDSQDLGFFTPLVNEAAVAPSAPVLTDVAANEWSTTIPIDSGGPIVTVAARPFSWWGWGSLTVSFDAPISDGGSPIRSIDVTAMDEASGEQATCTASPDYSSCDIGGLRAGDTYVVTATATNGAGTSPTSDPMTATLPTDPTSVDVTDVSATEDPATGAWWAHVTLSTPATALTRPFEVFGDQGDACTVTLAEGDTTGSCQIADAGADQPTGLTVMPIWVFPVVYDKGSEAPGDGGSAADQSGSTPTPAAAPSSVIEASSAGPATEPALSSITESSPALIEAVPPADTTEQSVSSDVVLTPAVASNRISSSSTGGIAVMGLLGLLVAASLMISLIRRSRA